MGVGFVKQVGFKPGVKELWMCRVVNKKKRQMQEQVKTHIDMETGLDSRSITERAISYFSDDEGGRARVTTDEEQA